MEMTCFCPGCNSTGILWARIKQSPFPAMPFIFRCMCSAGDREKRNYPQWRRELKDQYETMKHEERIPVAK